MNSSYSDLSLPNLEQDLDSEVRCPLKKKNLIHKKKSKNFVRFNRKKNSSKKTPKKTYTFKRAFSPEYKIQIYDEDSASCQSDCVSNLREEDASPTREVETRPLGDRQNDEGYCRLAEAMQRRELVLILEGFRLCEEEGMAAE